MAKFLTTWLTITKCRLLRSSRTKRIMDWMIPGWSLLSLKTDLRMLTQIKRFSLLAISTRTRDLAKTIYETCLECSKISDLKRQAGTTKKFTWTSSRYANKLTWKDLNTSFGISFCPLLNRSKANRRRVLTPKWKITILRQIKGQRRKRATRASSTHLWLKSWQNSTMNHHQTTSPIQPQNPRI